MANNIDNARDVVVLGQIATIQQMILAWQIYSERTGESVTDIISDFQKEITALQKLLSST